MIHKTYRDHPDVLAAMARADLRTYVVREWNRGRLTMRELGDRIGKSRNVISGILTRAREAGMYVLSIDEQTYSERKRRGKNKFPLAGRGRTVR